MSGNVAEFIYTSGNTSYYDYYGGSYQDSNSSYFESENRNSYSWDGSAVANVGFRLALTLK